MNESLSHSGLAGIGSVLLFGGVCVFCLYVVDTAHGLPFPMPMFWGGNMTLWPFVGILMFVGGMLMLRSLSRRPEVAWTPSRPGQRFLSVILYTREGCHLCEEAVQLLAAYRPWLPEVVEVDIDTEPELRAEFDQTIPVVAFDGQVRFQGPLSEPLLQRLIEGTPPLMHQLPVLGQGG